MIIDTIFMHIHSKVCMLAFGCFCNWPFLLIQHQHSSHHLKLMTVLYIFSSLRMHTKSLKDRYVALSFRSFGHY